MLHDDVCPNCGHPRDARAAYRSGRERLFRVQRGHPASHRRVWRSLQARESGRIMLPNAGHLRAADGMMIPTTSTTRMLPVHRSDSAATGLLVAALILAVVGVQLAPAPSALCSVAVKSMYNQRHTSVVLLNKETGGINMFCSPHWGVVQSVVLDWTWLGTHHTAAYSVSPWGSMTPLDANALKLDEAARYGSADVKQFLMEP